MRKRIPETVAVELTGVVYDREGLPENARPRKNMTVDVACDMLDCFVENDGTFDSDEAKEFLCEIVEEKIGIPVLDILGYAWAI